jgi:cyclohexadieny/prephenate dehydrogenase
MKLRVLTIVGVGLLGGSIGLAARRRGIVDCVRGLGRSRESLDEAKALGAIDEVHLDPTTAIPGSDLVVVCTPVDLIAETVLQHAAVATPGTIFTDVGSTKKRIVDDLEGKLPPGIVFVGSHPLAGSEKRGVRYADADLFVGRMTVVTMSQKNFERPVPDAVGMDFVVDFWQAIGSTCRFMLAEYHDKGVATTSHLPHLIASTLACVVPMWAQCLVATGYRDTTRIAAGDPGLWTAIFEQNRDELLNALDRFDAQLGLFRQAIEKGDHSALHAMLAEAKKNRDAIDS